MASPLFSHTAECVWIRMTTGLSSMSRRHTVKETVGSSAPSRTRKSSLNYMIVMFLANRDPRVNGSTGLSKKNSPKWTYWNLLPTYQNLAYFYILWEFMHEIYILQYIQIDHNRLWFLQSIINKPSSTVNIPEYQICYVYRWVIFWVCSHLYINPKYSSPSFFPCSVPSFLRRERFLNHQWPGHSSCGWHQAH